MQTWKSGNDGAISSGQKAGMKEERQEMAGQFEIYEKFRLVEQITLWAETENVLESYSQITMLIDKRLRQKMRKN